MMHILEMTPTWESLRREVQPVCRERCTAVIATLGDIHMSFCWRCTKCCKGVDFHLWSVGSYVHFVPFFHGFVSSQRRFAWNSCVLEPSAEKKTSFFTIFWHCLLCGPVCPVQWQDNTQWLSIQHVCNDKTKDLSCVQDSMHAMTRQKQLRNIQHVCSDKTNTVA